MSEVLIFAAKTLLVVGGFAAIVILIAAMVARAQQATDLEITPLHERWKNVGQLLRSFLLNKDELKAEKKKLKKEEKAEESATPSQRVFVLQFRGDIKAHQVDNLREEISAILQVANDKDEVVAVIHSPGGAVTGYGLAASQLLRLRENKIPLTACIDEVAASGGYLMASVANKILAAPFAVVGSIGVVAGIPNLHRLLKKLDVDYKEYTAGEFKRTVTFLGEITPKGEQKFLEQLEETHTLFKGFVQKYRPQIDMSKVATGEYWYGETAVGLGLIDGLRTSDDYLLEKIRQRAHVFEVKYEKKLPLSEKISEFLGAVLVRTSEKIHHRLTQRMSESRDHKVL
jgi:serine protease SohB